MLQLRLEVVSSESPNELCNQATRLASHIGVQVVFEYNGKDITAKPGMDAASLLSECQAAPAEMKAPKESKEAKTTKDKEPKPQKEQKQPKQEKEVPAPAEVPIQ
jgi:hypothetical protein